MEEKTRREIAASRVVRKGVSVVSRCAVSQTLSRVCAIHCGGEPARQDRDIGQWEAEKMGNKKACLECKSREGLIGEKRPLDRPGCARELALIRAELEGHHDAGDDAEPEKAMPKILSQNSRMVRRPDPAP